MIQILPLTFEDGIETPEHIFDGVIEFLSEGMEPIEFEKIKVHHQAIPSECHRVSLLIRLLNPNYKHYIGLSTLATQFLRYRIRGIKIKYTIYPQKTDPATHEPVFFYVNAQAAGTSIGESDQGPIPPFPTQNIFNTPEQRWAKYAPVKFPMAGAAPTRLTVYYSVNKVFGPDAIVKNDESFTGQLKTTLPYWDNVPGAHPVQGIWIQHGVSTLSNIPTTVVQNYTYVMQATLYTEFFGKRVMTE